MHNLYKRNRNWYLDFSFHGKRIRQMYGPSRKGAEQAISKIKGQIAENKFIQKREDPALVLFHEYAVDYLELTRPNKRESSYKNELSVMRRLDRVFGGKIFQHLTADDVERYKGKRLRDGVMPATINREVALLKSMFSKALQWNKASLNPAKGVKLLDGENERVRYLMPEELNHLLSNCSGILKALVTIAAHTGLRKGELFSLLWQNVNLDLGIITILKENAKNKTARHVPMNAMVKTTLTQLERRGPFVFGKADGKPLQNSNVRKPFEKAVRETGITDFRFHDLRHTCASNLVMAGIDILRVKELLGHKDLKATLRYSHLNPRYMADAVEVLGKRLANLAPEPHGEEAEKKGEWASA